MVAVLVLGLALTGCGTGGHDHAKRQATPWPAAVLAVASPTRCLKPGRHLYYQLIRVRESAFLTYLHTGAPQPDLARPPLVETLRIFVHPKPVRYKPTIGTRPWPYGMGPTVSKMTGWEDSYDPLALPDDKPRYLDRGWNYVFVLLYGHQGGRADVRIGWESRSRHTGEIRIARGIRFDKSC